jgi:hypothetical protein
VIRFDATREGTRLFLVPRGASRRPHRASIRICALVYLSLGALAACGAAYAQTSEQPSAALQPKDRANAAAPKMGKEETTEQIKERGKAWFRQCMQDWDAATHMTKAEWERTCRRVAIERTKFLMEQPK